LPSEVADHIRQLDLDLDHDNGMELIIGLLDMTDIRELELWLRKLR